LVPHWVTVMEVVTNGTFTIDAAAQLAGKPSMMNPEGGPAMTGHQHGGSPSSSSQANAREKDMQVFKKQLAGLMDPYMRFKNALVSSDADAAAKEARSLNNALKKIDMKKLKPNDHNTWMPLSNAIEQASATASNADDIEAQRKSLSVITDSYIEAINKFSLSGLNTYYQYCPMVFDNKGGYWISETEEIKNPYLGSKMMSCGETVREIK